MHVLQGAVTPDQAFEIAVAHALVRRASTGELGETLRVYQPQEPVVVFGRRDVRLPGFPRAVRAAHDRGFQTAVRAAGGRAVAYTPAALVLDHVRHDRAAMAGQEARFERFGDVFVDAFQRLGVAAQVGPVPGEYCPGAHSVNARGVAKLVGTAQRVVRDAWLFSSLVVVGDEDLLRPALREVYDALGQPFDEGAVGSLRAEAPGLRVADVEDAVLTAYGASARIGGLSENSGGLSADTVRLAGELVAGHRTTEHGADMRPRARPTVG